MMAAEVVSGASFRVGQRSSLFELPPTTLRSDIFMAYDVGYSYDRQFLMSRAFVDVDRDDDSAPAMVLVTHWIEELRARVPN